MIDYRQYVRNGELPLESLLLHFEDQEVYDALEDIKKQKPSDFRVKAQRGTLQRLYPENWQEVEGRVTGYGWDVIDTPMRPVRFEDLKEAFGEDSDGITTVLKRAKSIGHPVSALAGTLQQDYGEDAPNAMQKFQQNGWLVYPDENMQGMTEAEIAKRLPSQQIRATTPEEQQAEMRRTTEDDANQRMRDIALFRQMRKEKEAVEFEQRFPTTVAGEPNIRKRFINRALTGTVEPIATALKNITTMGTEEPVVETGVRAVTNIFGNATKALWDMAQGDPVRYQQLSDPQRGKSIDEDLHNAAKAANSLAMLSPHIMSAMSAFGFTGAITRTLADIGAEIVGKQQTEAGSGGLQVEAGGYRFDLADPVGSAFGIIPNVGEQLAMNIGLSPETGAEIGNLGMLLFMGKITKSAKEQLNGVRKTLKKNGKLTPEQQRLVDATAPNAKTAQEKLAELEKKSAEIDNNEVVIDMMVEFEKAARTVLTPEELKQYTRAKEAERQQREVQQYAETMELQRAAQAERQQDIVQKYTEGKEQMRGVQELVAKSENARQQEAMIRYAAEKEIERKLIENLQKGEADKTAELEAFIERTRPQWGEMSQETMLELWTQEQLRKNAEAKLADMAKQDVTDTIVGEVPGAESIGAQAEGQRPQIGPVQEAAGGLRVRDVTQGGLEAQAGKAEQAEVQINKPINSPLDVPDIKIDVGGREISMRQMPIEEQNAWRQLTDTQVAKLYNQNDPVGLFERWRRTAERMENRAKDNIDDLGGPYSSGFAYNPKREALLNIEYARIMAAKIIKGVADFGKLSEAMAYEYSQRPEWVIVQPKLKEIYDQAVQLVEFAKKLPDETPESVFDTWRDAQYEKANAASMKKYKGNLRVVGEGKVKDVSDNIVWNPQNTVRSKLVNRLLGNGILRPTQSLFNRVAQRWRTRMTDDLAQMVDIVSAAEDTVLGRVLLPEENPVTLFRRIRKHHSMMEDVLENGVPDPSNMTGPRLTGPFSDILKPFGDPRMQKTEDLRREQARYMIAKRTIEEMEIAERKYNDAMAAAKGNKMAEKKATTAWETRKRDNERGMITGIGEGKMSDTARAQQIVDSVATDPVKQQIFDQAHRNYMDWAQNLAFYAKEAGLITDKSYQRMVNSRQSYADIHRFFNELDNEFMENRHPMVSNALGTIERPFKKFKGSGRQILDPYLNLMMSTAQVIHAADKNIAKNAFRNMFVEAEAKAVGSGQESWMTAFGHRVYPVKGKLPEHVTFMVDGKREHWTFEPELMQAFKGMDKVGHIPGTSQFVSMFSKGVTSITPFFAVRNMFRDAWERAINSFHGSKPWDSIKSYSDAEVESITRGGGAFSGFYMKNPTDYYRTMKTILTHSGFKNEKGQTVYFIPEMWDKYQKAISSSEMQGRLSEFRRAKKFAKEKLGYDEWNSELYAAGEAAGLMDFTRVGTWMRFVREVVPFSNAAMQGTARSIRTMMQNPGRMMAKIFTFMVIPKAIEYAVNNRDEESRLLWQQLPSYRKDMFLNFHAGNDFWISIPMGFNAAVMASSVNRIMDAAINKNPSAFSGYGTSLGSMADIISPFDVLGPLKVPFEVAMNKNTFYNKMIVPPSDEGAALELRKGHKTAPTAAKAIGNALNIDARIVDHVLQGYFTNGYKLFKTITNLPEEKATPTDALQSFLGLFGSSPDYGAPDVQYLLEQFAYYKEKTTKQAAHLSNLTDKIRSAKTAEEREQWKIKLLKYAKSLRAYYESRNRNRIIEKKSKRYEPRVQR